MYGAGALPEVAKIRDKLLAFTRSGKAAFGISFHAFFEFIQADATEENAYQADRLSRANFISDICELWSFPYISELNDGSKITRTGIWMPGSVVSEIDIDHFMVGLRREFANHRPINKLLGKNRSDRRRLRADHGAFVAMVRANPTVLKGLIEKTDQFPGQFSLLRTDLLRQYIFGQVSRSTANSALVRDLTHPENVYRYWFEQGRNANPANEFNSDVWNKISKLTDQYLKLRSQVAEDIGTIKKNDAVFKKIAKDNSFPPNYVDDELSMSKALRHAMEEAISAPPVVDRLRVFSGRNVENLECSLGAVATAVINAVINNEIKNERSLAGDIAHAAYLPLCDLWRGDNAMVRVLSKARVPNYEKIVPNLMLLPDRIESELSKI
jgi:hypothetical protein